MLTKSCNSKAPNTGKLVGFKIIKAKEYDQIILDKIIPQSQMATTGLKAEIKC